ncbi:MAG TPA: tetratricopeptide repeat protein, partial [Isosphaeraceae bacterium]|nr:tetratricopeptide repeat protein [Isosphaeraceae bacterium]
DNLAKSTASAHGYNSEGVHSGIREGIEICRRTGKLECIHCFREYATDVYKATDDLDMALHHARFVREHGGVRKDFDRRWAGAKDESEVLLIAGRLDEAEVVALRALELASLYHNPMDANLSTRVILDTVRLLKGQPESAPDETLPEVEPPAAGEYPSHEFRLGLRDAVRASVRGDHAKAIRILTEWDLTLTQKGCLADWFECRLRLIASYRLRGQMDRAQALGKPLESRAKEASDWLTLRRLARVLDPAQPTSPIAAAGPLSAGPYTGSGPASEPQAAVEVADDDEAGEETPLSEAIGAFLMGLREGDAEAEGFQERGMRDLMNLARPGEVTHPMDASAALHFMNMLANDAEMASEIWTWAEALAAPFPENPSVVSLLADLGDTLRQLGEPAASLIGEERITNLFQKSLDLDPNNARVYARAGAAFLSNGRIDEAERMLARAFRLDRANAFVALRLAGIYGQTDRARDALAVLDLALREGCEEPEVAWRASLAAFGLDQWEVLLTYLDRFETLAPGEEWTNYYRASGLLELDRVAEAREAIEEEARRTQEPALHLEILRAWAASIENQPDEVLAALDRVLEIRLSEVETLTRTGLVRLFDRLWKSVQVLPEDQPSRQRLAALLLQTGLAPNEFFTPFREAEPEQTDLTFYVCTVRQPLDDRWPQFVGCLASETSWPAYDITWGVLAADEEDAAQRVLRWQSRCYPIDAEILDISARQDGFEERPGVVWQGFREGVETEEA